jgi:hypothetical protein
MLFAAEIATTHKALANVDLAIIGVYFLIVFGIGFYFSRRERTSEEYFLAGRDIGWFFIGASLFVSNISTEHFIGLSGTGASSGLAVGHFEWLACLIARQRFRLSPVSSLREPRPGRYCSRLSLVSSVLETRPGRYC